MEHQVWKKGNKNKFQPHKIYLSCSKIQIIAVVSYCICKCFSSTDHVFPSVPAVDHFDEPVPRSRLRGHSEKNTDELPLFVRRRRDARSIPSSTNHQLQWQTWLLRSEYKYLFGTKGINIAFDTYMNNIVHQYRVNIRRWCCNTPQATY